MLWTLGGFPHAAAPPVRPLQAVLRALHPLSCAREPCGSCSRVADSSRLAHTASPPEALLLLPRLSPVGQHHSVVFFKSSGSTPHTLTNDMKAGLLQAVIDLTPTPPDAWTPHYTSLLSLAFHFPFCEEVTTYFRTGPFRLNLYAIGSNNSAHRFPPAFLDQQLCKVGRGRTRTGRPNQF